MVKRPEMVLIDLDGTLVDSVPDLADSVDAMMTALGLPTRGEKLVRDWVGNGVARLVRRALSGEMDGEPEQALFERGYPIFMESYAQNTCGRSRLYDGVSEGLEALHRLGLKVGCVTNKAERFTLPLLEGLGLSERFSLVLSGDSLPVKKPHPMPLLHAAARFHVEPQNALMVGDSISDVKAARAAGFSVICVSYGYNHGVDIHTAEPDGVIDSLAQLPGLFDAEVA